MPFVASADSQPPVGIESEAAAANEGAGEAAPAEPAPVPVSKSGGDDQIYLQIGSFKSRANAERLRDRISALVGAAVEVVNTAAWYRVRLGPMLDSAEAGFRVDVGGGGDVEVGRNAAAFHDRVICYTTERSPMTQLNSTELVR